MRKETRETRATLFLCIRSYYASVPERAFGFFHAKRPATRSSAVGVSRSSFFVPRPRSKNPAEPNVEYSSVPSSPQGDEYKYSPPPFRVAATLTPSGPGGPGGPVGPCGARGIGGGGGDGAGGLGGEGGRGALGGDGGDGGDATFDGDKTGTHRRGVPVPSEDSVCAAAYIVNPHASGVAASAFRRREASF